MNTSPCEESSGDSGDDWEGLDEETTISVQTTCLFCPEIFNNAEIMFQHCESQHLFDLFRYSTKMGFTCISYIQFINFMRHNKYPSAKLMEINKEFCPWLSEEYMKPFDATDPLLTFDFEGYASEKKAEGGDAEESVTLPRSQFEALLQELADTELKFQNASNTVEKMKDRVNSLISSAPTSSTNHDNFNSAKRKSSSEEDYYFSTYDHFAIHHEMLQDKVRTSSYQDAILKNSHVFLNKRVMDLGCGTGILSMFAAKAGAAKVVAVDKSDVIYQAMDIVRENGFDDVINVCKGRIEDVEFPENKVDIIVSEWMGYFLLFEGMLDSVLYARDNYLVPGGLMFPDRCNLALLAVCDTEKYKEYIDFWDDVYGFKMSTMKRDVAREANVEAVKGEAACSDPVVVKEFDLLTCSLQDAAEFHSSFELTMLRDCTVTALVGYFDSFFEKGLSHKVVLSTSPLSTPTHWKQTMFLLPQTVPVTKGEKVKCRISCRKNRRDPRSLIVRLEFGNCQNMYYLS